MRIVICAPMVPDVRVPPPAGLADLDIAPDRIATSKNGAIHALETLAVVRA